MAAETPQMELELLQRRAEASNYFVQRHKYWDPSRGTGDLYLQRKRKFRGEHVDTLMRYATADEIHAELGRIEAENRKRA